jgi:hypothetical protein
MYSHRVSTATEQLHSSGHATHKRARHTDPRRGVNNPSLEESDLGAVQLCPQAFMHLRALQLAGAILGAQAPQLDDVGAGDQGGYGGRVNVAVQEG